MGGPSVDDKGRKGAEESTERIHRMEKTGDVYILKMGTMRSSEMTKHLNTTGTDTKKWPSCDQHPPRKLKSYN
jgi:hypothetical protein